MDNTHEDTHLIDTKEQNTEDYEDEREFLFEEINETKSLKKN